MNEIGRVDEARDREALSLTSVVIVGAGHAGVQAAASLREQGFDGEVVLLSAEKDPPYQRPPLSKRVSQGAGSGTSMAPAQGRRAHFREQRIDLRLGVGAKRIDRLRSKWSSATAARAYGHLILPPLARSSGGSVPRGDLPGVFAVRDIADATAIRERAWREAQGCHHRRLIHRARNRRDRRARGRGDSGRDRAPMGRAVSPIMSDFS
jgi:3-phenylpropionate/trans-cinnamate dioxygenase ferredoxin reductase subunit